MKIVVDAMGGDNAPLEIVKGALMAAREFEVDIVLVGRGEDILRSLQELGESDLPANVEITGASQVVEMEDDPATVTKQKADSSMTVGLRILHEGRADAMVSAGSTGALLSGATLLVKRVRGIRRACLAPMLPTPSNGGTLMVDVGANAECTPEYLLQFAFMGSYFVKSAKKVENPKVGLLNIGAEETKGSTLYKEAHQLLKKAGEEGRINFIGNVEARDVMNGVCDVLVSDGFAGNILLKSIEGMGIFFMGSLKTMFKKGVLSKLAALILKSDLMALKKLVSSEEVGGTALLGIQKPVIKAHGSSNAYAIRSAIRQAVAAAQSNVAELIAQNIEYMKVKEPSQGAEHGDA